MKSNSVFYFCHSYYVNSGDHKNIIAETEYSNINFCSTIKKDNLYGCQFHPERSGKDGEIFLKNFINI